MDTIKTIEKVSDTVYKRKIVTPEIITPEKIEEFPVTLDEAEKELSDLENDIRGKEASREFDAVQYEDAMKKHDDMLRPLYAKREELLAEIQNAKDMGVKVEEKLEPADMLKDVPLQEEVISN